MNLDIFDRRRAERFAQLLDETNGGLRHHARGQADDQLTDLVGIGQALSAVRPAVHVDSEFRTGLRAMLVATAERDGIGSTADDHTESAHAVVPQSRRGAAFAKGTGRRIRARGAIVMGVAAGAIAVSGLSNASENAAPGDALYGVKRSTERAQMALAGSDVTRGQLSLDFARNRLAEAAALDGDDPAFADVLKDMDNDTRQGVRLLTTSAVARKDKAPLNVIDTFVSAQRRTIGPMLDKLGPANQERALASMSLLDDIDRRARGLRTGLDCGTDAALETDLLGPKPRPCWAGGQNAEDPGQDTARTGTTGGRSSDRAPADGSEPAVGPAADGGAVDRKDGQPAGKPAQPIEDPAAGPGQAPDNGQGTGTGTGTGSGTGSGTGTQTGTGSDSGSGTGTDPNQQDADDNSGSLLDGIDILD